MIEIDKFFYFFNSPQEHAFEIDSVNNVEI